MNIQSIISTNGIGIALCIILLFCSALTRRNNSYNDRLLTIMLYIIASCCICESVAFILDGRPGLLSWVLGMLSNTWLYFFNITFSLFWCLYVDYHLYHSRTRL